MGVLKVFYSIDIVVQAGKAGVILGIMYVR